MEENLIENHTPLPYGLRNPFRNLKSGELSRLRPETSKKLYVHEFGFCPPIEYMTQWS
jgi:hypothetical protein